MPTFTVTLCFNDDDDVATSSEVADDDDFVELFVVVAKVLNFELISTFFCSLNSFKDMTLVSLIIRL